MSSLNNIFYNIQGSGTPVVFLHGFLENHTMWDSVISRLTNIQSISIDLAGHGQSPIKENATMQSMAIQVGDILNREDIKNPIIIGHSMGGYVGLELMHLIPISKLVLLHSNFWADTPEKKHNRDRVIKIVDVNKEIFVREAISNLFNPSSKPDFQDKIDALTQESLQMPKGHIIKASLALRDRIDHAHTIEQFANQITMIHGLQDPIITNEEVEENLSKLDQKPMLELINDCGHMGHLEKPQLVLELLNRLLDN